MTVWMIDVWGFRTGHEILVDRVYVEADNLAAAIAAAKEYRQGAENQDISDSYVATFKGTERR